MSREAGACAAAVPGPGAPAPALTVTAGRAAPPAPAGAIRRAARQSAERPHVTRRPAQPGPTPPHAPTGRAARGRSGATARARARGGDWARARARGRRVLAPEGSPSPAAGRVEALRSPPRRRGLWRPEADPGWERPSPADREGSPGHPPTPGSAVAAYSRGRVVERAPSRVRGAPAVLSAGCEDRTSPAEEPSTAATASRV